jgi:RNA polymerase sigma factor (sigma-70 family)
MRNYSDAEILKGILEEDTRILTWIYQTSFKSILKFIKDQYGDEEDAEDVFQDAMMVIFKKVQNDELVLSSSFSTYLFSVAKYIWYNEIRRKITKGTVRKEVDEYEDIYDDIADIHIKVERDKLVRKHFETLPSYCKKLLTFVFQEFSISEITKEMNYSSEQHTKNRRLKCKTILYNKIKNDPKFKELKGEQHRESNKVPRW